VLDKDRASKRLIEKNVPSTSNISALLLNNSTGIQNIESKTTVTLTAHYEMIKEEIKDANNISLQEEEKSKSIEYVALKESKRIVEIQSLEIVGVEDYVYEDEIRVGIF
jgi:hypothetical protein